LIEFDNDIYETLYSNIPNTQEERVNLILQTKNADVIKQNIQTTVDDLARIRKRKLTFTWYLEPVPSKRPRANSSGGYPQIYVPNAALIKREFQKFFRTNFPKFKPIHTPITLYQVRSYLRTPTWYPRSYKVLAELGVIIPWGKNHGDVDNFYKAYSDCAIGTLMEDDRLIGRINSEKFFSLKPRVEFEITFLERWPKGLEKLIK